VNLVAAVQMMKDGRRADHRVPREVEFFEEVEDVHLPMMLQFSRIEKDGLELAHLGRDLGHLGSGEVARVGKDGQAVAAIGRRGEHVGELEPHPTTLPGRPPYDRAVPTPEILRSSPLAEEILESHRHRAHGDDAGYDAYKAHVYRVVNFARALAPDEPDRDDKLAIAAAFHDLAVFDTLDYLVPSIEAQDAWLQQTGRESWSDELALIVAEHHRLSGYGPARPYAPLVEAVRRADLVDVSQGLIRFGLPSSYVKEVRATFDAGVFFKRVIPLGTLRAVRKFQQPGFLRPGNALARSGHDGADR
jgi:hypothetical protein